MSPIQACLDCGLSIDDAEELILCRRKARSIMRSLVRADGMDTESGTRIKTKSKHDTPRVFDDALSFLIVMGWVVRRKARVNGSYLVIVATAEARWFLTQPISRKPAKLERCLNTSAGIADSLKLEHDGGEEFDDGFDIEEDE